MWPAVKVLEATGRDWWPKGRHDGGGTCGGGTSASMSASQVTGSSGPSLVAYFNSLWTGSGHKALTESFTLSPVPKIVWKSRCLRPGVFRSMSSRVSAQARVKTSARVGAGDARAGGAAGSSRRACSACTARAGVVADGERWEERWRGEGARVERQEVYHARWFGVGRQAKTGCADPCCRYYYARYRIVPWQYWHHVERWLHRAVRCRRRSGCFVPATSDRLRQHERRGC